MVDRRAHCAHSFSLATLSDTVNYTMMDSTGQVDDERGLQNPRGFHSNADGTLVIEGSGNISGHTVTLNISNTLYYPYGVRKFMATGTCLGAGGSIVAMR